MKNMGFGFFLNNFNVNYLLHEAKLHNISTHILQFSFMTVMISISVIPSYIYSIEYLVLPNLF